MVRYYGWYSNPPSIRAGKSLGVRNKQGILKPGELPEQEPVNIELIDVSDHQPPRMPSKRWREFIKKTYEVDPLCCLNVPVRTALAGRGGEMKIISFIDEFLIIKQILEHLGLPSRMASKAGGHRNLPETHQTEIPLLKTMS